MAYTDLELSTVFKSSMPANVNFHSQTTSQFNDMAEEISLDKTASSGAVSMSPELFEKLYLTPKAQHTGDNIKRYANPTAMALVGFVISDLTLATNLMGWGGASGLTPVVGIFFFVGPVLLTLALIFEWIMGNFFSMMVCALFDVFWLSNGLVHLPTLGLAAPYSASGTDNVRGAASPEYNAALALFYIIWGFALVTYTVFTLRTNVVFVLIFVFSFVGAFTLSGAFWKVSTGDFIMAHNLQVAGAALFFVVGCLGWYMILVIMSAEMAMTTKLPVGDLSRFRPHSDEEMGRGRKTD